MKVEIRKFKETQHLLLIAESSEESEMMDTVLGKIVQAEGHIADVKGSVQLADGYREHYIRLEPDVSPRLALLGLDRLVNASKALLEQYKRIIDGYEMTYPARFLIIKYWGQKYAELESALDPMKRFP